MNISTNNNYPIRKKSIKPKLELNDFLLRYMIVPTYLMNLKDVKKNLPDIYNKAMVNRVLDISDDVFEVHYNLFDMVNKEVILPIQGLTYTSNIPKHHNLHLLDDYKVDIETFYKKVLFKTPCKKDKIINIYAHEDNWILAIYQAKKHKKFVINNRYLRNYSNICNTRQYKILSILKNK